MSYSINLKSISLPAFYQRLRNGYLLPGQMILKENPDETLACLQQQGLKTMYDIQQSLKSSSRLQQFARESGLSEKYLTCLRREVNSYQPKPVELVKFPNIQNGVLNKLKSEGIKNTHQLFEAVINKNERQKLSEKTNIPYDEILYLTRLTDLSRIKWVGPSFAQLLVECEFDCPEKVSNASGQEVYQKLITVNRQKHLYKGKIGENDMHLLVQVAGDVPKVIQYDD